MRLPSRAEIEHLAAGLPRPRTIYSIDGRHAYLSRYYLHGRPSMPDGSEPFDERGDALEGAVWPKSLGVYLHRFHRGDEDREVHNHPWDWSFSIILVGGYREQRRVLDEFAEADRMWSTEDRILRPGDVNHIGRHDFHRVELLDGECWTLFVAGPKTASWGFWSQQRGFEPWREFVNRKREAVVSSSRSVE